MTKAALIILIYKTAALYGLPPALFKAVIMQESSLSLQEAKKTGDLGVGQINPHTADAFGWDKGRLKEDIRYNIDCSALFLKYLRNKWEKKEPFIWFTRYHSNNLVLRFRYKLALSKRLDNL